MFVRTNADYMARVYTMWTPVLTNKETDLIAVAGTDGPAIVARVSLGGEKIANFVNKIICSSPVDNADYDSFNHSNHDRYGINNR